MNLFLSYTMRDGNITLMRLKHASLTLLKYGSVFADAIHNGDGDRQARVERELVNSDLIIFIETASFRESIWVTRERYLAQKLSKKAISIKWKNGEKWETVLETVVAAVKLEVAANNAMHTDGNSLALDSYR